MNGMRTTLILSVAFLAWPAVAACEDFSDAFVGQSAPSDLDPLAITVFGICEGPVFEQPPTIQTVESSADESGDYYVHELNVDWKRASCPSTHFPNFGSNFPIAIGRLPVGRHTVHVIAHDVDQEAIRLDKYLYFRVSGRPGPPVSGAWYAPEQSGRGIFITRVPLPADQAAGSNTFAVYWATHDANGDPTWALTSGEMTDNILTGTAVTTHGTPLAPGPADLPQETWGTLSFEYTGCGHGTLSWDAADPATTDGSVNIIQLARPDGLEACEFQPDAEAVWID